MNIAIFAAGGNVGRRITQEALQRGHRVTAVVRDPARFNIADGAVRVVQGDATDPASVASVVDGCEAIVSAVGPNRPNGQSNDVFSRAARGLIEGARRVHVKRLIVVGGAGVLEVAPGVQAIDTPGFPEEWKGEALGAREARAIYRTEALDLDWTYICPAALMEPGERTGSYRVGFDQMLFNADVETLPPGERTKQALSGASRISMEDYAVAVLDELEHGAHIRKQIAVAY